MSNALVAVLSIASITAIMPRYDYECPGELETVEMVLPIEHERPRCTTCGAYMNQVYAATPAIFKGNGWGSKP